MDRTRVGLQAWCAREGPIVARYAEIGVPCQVMRLMPRFSALPQLSRNILALARIALAFHRARPFLAALLRETSTVDLIHLNHESLFLVGRWLRRRRRVPIVLHMRTMLPQTAIARWQVRLINRYVDRVVFISENERDCFARLGGDLSRGRVIYNIARPPAEPARRHPAIPEDGRFNVATLANFALVRGTDRLLDVAAELKRRGRRDIRLVVAGDMRLKGRLPVSLRAADPAAETLDALAHARGLDDMMLFLGHVAAPEQVLVASDVLLRTSRGNDPWGRDVLEALAAGKPVIATGSYDRFVETGVTGVLLPDYSAAAAADAICALADDRAQAVRLGAAGRNRVATLCDGPARAADLLGVWREAAGVSS